MKIKPLLKLGSCFVVGNGQSISVWDDLWIPLIPGFKPSEVHPRSIVAMTVNELIDSAMDSGIEILFGLLLTNLMRLL